MKQIENYPNYFVNENGDVFSNKRGSLKKINPWSKDGVKHGYKLVTLYNSDGRLRISVHRLVAQAYISNVENKPYINHKNSNPSNNNVDNLEWCTHRENILHSWTDGLNIENRKLKISKANRGVKSHLSKLSAENVLEIREKYSTGKYLYRELADMFNIDPTNIGAIITRKTWKHI